MCKLKKYHGTSNTKIDKCMIPLIRWLTNRTGYKVKACCCGHGKYPITIVVGNTQYNWELLSNEIIPRKRNFYKRDKQGYYYIQELQDVVTP